MGGRRDLDSLRLSQRSNGLAFSHHHFLATSSVSASPTRPAKRFQPSILTQSDGNAPARPRHQGGQALPDNSKAVQKLGMPTRQAIKSLIPPLPPKRVYNDVILSHPGRVSRRRASISSTISSHSFLSTASRKRKFTIRQSIATMPAEILHIIFKDLSQKDLHALMLANSNIAEAAATLMYKKPLFASTYRYAQFAHIVSHKKHYGDMVRELDLSPFWSEDKKDDEEPQAGWREWKYRNDTLYRANRDRPARYQPVQSPVRRPSSSHPPPSPFLRAWSYHRDLPLGGLCHVLIACQRITKVNISRLQLGVDFLVSHKDFPATTWTGEIYVSDVPKSWTWAPKELHPIHNIYIIDQLRKLPHLETVIANHFVSMSTLMVQELVDHCISLKWVDFRKSGMESEPPWSVEGDTKMLQGILRKMEEKAVKSPDPRRRTPLL